MIFLQEAIAFESISEDLSSLITGRTLSHNSYTPLNGTSIGAAEGSTVAYTGSFSLASQPFLFSNLYIKIVLLFNGNELMFGGIFCLRH